MHRTNISGDYILLFSTQLRNFLTVKIHGMWKNITFTHFECYIMFFICPNICYLHYSSFGLYNSHNTPRLRTKSLKILSALDK